MLERLHPDVAVVPESSETPSFIAGSLLNEPIPHAWVGDQAQPKKGLGVFAPGAVTLTRHATRGASGARWALPVHAAIGNEDVHVLAVWTHPFDHGGRRTKYMNALWALLADHEEFLGRGDVVVAGDVNCSAQSSPDDFADLLGEIRDRFGLRSAYHHHRGVEIGSEADMTLWWRRDERAGYHCDLVLVPEGLEIMNVEVGTYQEWGASTLPLSSDHAPVTVELARS